MPLRTAPEGPVMTAYDFNQAAMDTPLSPWATLTGATADALDQTFGAGSVIREAQTPSLAKKVIRGGRGGVQWQDESPAEVQARGDTLYQTEDQFKTSPNYREGIPFEKGMTASRAKALADMHDLSAVRDYFNSKRPVVKFIGTLAGSALDPINYIPVVNEAAGAAAVGRFGRIAGRAIVGAGDAAASTALFGLVTAPERAKFGDDISWDAIMGNAAYAALAGGIFGGIRGGVSAFRARGIRAPGEIAPRPEFNPPNVSREVGAPRPGDIQPTGPAPRAFDYRLDLPAEVTAKLEGQRVAAEPSVHLDAMLSRLETVANKAKSADVMNDAIFGMIHDGEVRLGERSQAAVQDLQVAATRADTSIRQDSFSIEEVSNAQKPMTIGKDSVVQMAADRRFIVKDAAGQPVAEAVVGIYPDGTASVQGIKSIGEKSNVLGPAAIRKIASAFKAQFPDIKEFVGSRVSGARPDGGLQVVKVRDTGGAPFARTAETKLNYTVPAPDGPAPGLHAGYSQIEIRQRPNNDPLKAEMDRIVNEAKTYGFDPTTGEHDLQPELDALRAQDAITPEEEAALKAADETYQAADAWGKVMEVAQSCVVKP